MAYLKLCSVEGCGNKHFAKQLCGKHYQRVKANGHTDTLSRVPLHVERMEYLHKIAADAPVENCIFWPFPRTKAGYASINVGRTRRVASRVICEIAHGSAPEPHYQAAHSCGNGHLACINPRHLSWKTPADNQADRIAHGTANRGSKHGLAKLNESQVIEIMALKGTRPLNDIAETYGVTFQTISDIYRGRRWNWLSNAAP